MDFYWPAWFMIIIHLANGVFTAIVSVICLTPKYAREYRHPLKMGSILVLLAAAELLIGLYLLNALKTDQFHPLWIFPIVIILGVINSRLIGLADNIGKPVLP